MPGCLCLSWSWPSPATSPTGITEKTCHGCYAVPQRAPTGLFLPALGGGCLTALICPLYLRIASAEESILDQGHNRFSRQSIPSDWSVTGCKGPAPSPQLETTLKGHPSSRTPVESAEALLSLYRSPAPPSAQSCSLPSPTTISLKTTPQEIFCMLIISESASRKT